MKSNLRLNLLGIVRRGKAIDELIKVIRNKDASNKLVKVYENLKEFLKKILTSYSEVSEKIKNKLQGRHS